MMSSRCPRPRGSIASIVVMPVSSGSVTGARSTMAGAGFSTGAIALARTLPSPSSGCPNGSTTRPRSASPTGTLMTDPVPRTIDPARMPSCGPSRMQPIDSSSSSTAIPRVSLANSTISFRRVSRSPSTVAMPSATRATRPTSSWVGPTSARPTRVLASRSQSPIASGSGFMALQVGADALDRPSPVRAPHSRAQA